MVGSGLLSIAQIEQAGTKCSVLIGMCLVGKGLFGCKCELKSFAYLHGYVPTQHARSYTNVCNNQLHSRKIVWNVLKHFNQLIALAGAAAIEEHAMTTPTNGYHQESSLLNISK